MFLGKHGIHVKQWLPGEKTSIQIFFSSFYLHVVMSCSIDFLFRTLLIRTEMKIRISNFLFHCYCSHSYSIVIRLLSSSQKDTSKDSYFIQSAYPACRRGSKETSCWKPIWNHSIENKANYWKLCRNSWNKSSNWSLFRN